MTFAEQIAALVETRKEKTARMKEVAQKSADESRSMEDAEAQEFDTLRDEIKRLDEDIARLKHLEDLERQDAATATPVDKQAKAAANRPAGSSSVIYAQPKARETVDKGVRFARYAMCLAQAKGNLDVASKIAQSRFANDEDLNVVVRAAVEAGTTTDAEWAGNLLEHNDLTTDFIEYLRPRTIIGRFGTDGIPALRPAPFNVHIKGQTAGGSANWVGEGYAKPVTKSGYEDVYLGWAKVAAISVISEELARFSTPGAEMLVRDDLAAAVIERIDTDFVDPDKAAGTGATASPPSVTNNATPTPSSGNDADAVRADIGALWATADSINLPLSSAVYITDSRTARQLSLMRNPLGQKEFPEMSVMGGTLDGVPVIVSNYVPSDSSGSLFILAFASEIFLADDGVVTLDASREASIQMDDAPNHNSGTPTGAQLVSMYQTNSIALRAERYINWRKRRPEAVAYLTGVNWGEPAA